MHEIAKPQHHLILLTLGLTPHQLDHYINLLLGIYLRDLSVFFGQLRLGLQELRLSLQELRCDFRHQLGLRLCIDLLGLAVGLAVGFSVGFDGIRFDGIGFDGIGFDGIGFDGIGLEIGSDFGLLVGLAGGLGLKNRGLRFRFVLLGDLLGVVPRIGLKNTNVVGP